MRRTVNSLSLDFPLPFHRLSVSCRRLSPPFCCGCSRLPPLPPPSVVAAQDHPRVPVLQGYPPEMFPAGYDRYLMGTMLHPEMFEIHRLMIGETVGRQKPLPPYHCSITALSLPHHCPFTHLPLRCRCRSTGLPLSCHCPFAAHPLAFPWPSTDLSLAFHWPFTGLSLPFHLRSGSTTIRCSTAKAATPVKRCLCLVLPLPSWLRHRLHCVFPVPSWLRHCLCLVLPLPPRLRYCLTLRS